MIHVVALNINSAGKSDFIRGKVKIKIKKGPLKLQFRFIIADIVFLLFLFPPPSTNECREDRILTMLLKD